MTVGSELIAQTPRAVTWEDYHPELKAIFDQPKTPWPCESIVTELTAHQPPLVLHRGEIFAQPGPFILHSTDGGRTWGKLCDVPIEAAAPEGFKMMSVASDALGVTIGGTLLFHYTAMYNDGRRYEAWRDPTLHMDAYVVRSTNRGKTWSKPIRIDPTPHNCAGSDRNRMILLPSGEMALVISTQTQARPDKPQPIENWWFEAGMFVSGDDGLTWRWRGSLGRYTCEADVLPLPSGRLLAVARYQRVKMPSDPAALIDPETKHGEVGGHSVLKQTMLLHSDDGGRTWSEPRLLTGWLQQTACLVRLSNGTIVAPFGHKTGNFGQRFLVSYDEGRTWTRRVYELHHGGLFASSVALEDDTIVTGHDNRKNPKGARFGALRWKAPTRAEAAPGGFFEPFPLHDDLRGPAV